MAKKKKIKKKLATGGFAQYEQPIQQGAMLAGSMVGAASGNSIGGQTASGVLSGVGAGAAFGPVGMAAGALIGGATSLIGAKKQKEEEESLRLAQARAIDFQARNNAIANSGKQVVARGGKLLSNKLKPLAGGGLVPVSNDAVQVQANNPQATDSVELQDAFVDHNEIIDNKDRVFSDEVIAPSGTSVAKEAAKLEKMKSDSRRFGDSNNRIETKLNDLFKYQEDTKRFQFEGKKEVTPFNEELNQRVLTRKNPEYLPDELQAKDEKFYSTVDKPTVGVQFDEFLRDRNMKKPLKARGGKLKPKYLFGTEDLIDPPGGVKKKPLFKLPAPINTSEFTTVANNLDTQPVTDIGSGPTLNQPAKSNFDINKGINTLATFAPNLINTALQKRLKGPPEPSLERATTLKRVSAHPQLASADRAYNQAAETIKSGTAGAGNLASATGNLLAKRLEAENQIFGNVNQQNIGISNQEASMNQAVGARNVERMNRFGENKTEFANKKLQLTSENVANLSGKIQAQGRERNMMNLDKQKYGILQQRYSELPASMKAKYDNIWDFYNSDDYKENQLYGGLLRKGKKLNKKKLGGKI